MTKGMLSINSLLTAILLEARDMPLEERHRVAEKLERIAQVLYRPVEEEEDGENQ